MKKLDILNLVNAGVQGATNHTLAPRDAYKVIKFRRALLEAYKTLCDEIKDNQIEAGIQVPESFDKERADLRALASRTADQDARLAELNEQYDRFAQLQNELLAEEVKLDCITMTYDAFHALQVENEKAIPALSAPYVEDVLEGTLWTAPEE